MEIEMAVFFRKESTMKRWIALLLFFALLPGMAACKQTADKRDAYHTVATPVYPQGIKYDNDAAKKELENDNTLSESFLSGLRTFTYKTASAVLSNADENVNYSPLSLYLALAIAGAGAKGSTQSEILSVLGAENTDRIAKLTLQIPRFSIDSKFELNPVLKKLGIRKAFQATADFTGITDGIAYISKVNQQTHIRVNEDGVEASAFTSILMPGAMDSKEEKEIILNRPFIYGIKDNNGNLLFVGVCGNPA